MASTFTLKSASYDGRYLELTCTQTKNIADNTSKIDWVLKSTGGSSSYYSTGATTVKINNEQVYYKARVAYSAQSFPAAKGSTSGSVTVKHNSDGSLTIPVSLATAIYTTSVTTKSGNWELDSNPRAATITSAPNFTDDENPVIKYSNPAGNSVDSLAICITFEGNNDDIAYRSLSKTGSSYTFNLTDAERNVLRNATTTSNSRTVKFYLRTIIGGTNYYSKVSKTLTIANPNPICNPTVVDTGTKSVTYTGDADNKLIKGYNTMAITFGASAVKGATIKSQKVTCGAKSLSADGTLAGVESGDFVFTVTDSRGNTITKTVKKTLINYFYPTVNFSSLKLSTEGELSFGLSGKVWVGNFGATTNTYNLRYRYKEKGGEWGSWATLTLSPGSDGSYTASESITGLDYQKNYVVQAAVRDTLVPYDSNSIKTPEKSVTALPVFDWGASDFNFNVAVRMPNGKAIRGTTTDGSYKTMLYMNTNDVLSLGGGTNAPNTIRIATADNAGTIQVNGVELDYIVEQGTKNGWYYRKWNKGIAECWKIAEFTTTINTAFGSMYCGNAAARQNYPFTFAEKPVETVTLQSGSTQGILYCESNGNGVNGVSASARYNVFRPGAMTTSSTFYLSFYVVGKWK